MKKILAIALALCMVLSLCAFAAADGRHFEIVVSRLEKHVRQCHQQCS